MTDVVVVGAGLGGLGTAVLLAAQGYQVVVCEQSGSIGGKLARFTRDGFAFDTGPHLLTWPDVWRGIFAETGAPLEDLVDIVSVDPATRYRFPDGTEVDVPNASRAGVSAALDAAVGARAGRQWTAMLDRAEAMWQVTREPFLESPLDGAATLVKQARRVDHLATVAPWQTLRGLGRATLDDPRLRMMLDRYATYSGSDPRQAPAVLATVPYLEQTYGAWYLPGGLHRLAELLVDRAKSLGVEIRLHADVRTIMVKDVPGPRGWGTTGVRLADGTKLRSDVVVANADAAHVYHDLLAGPPGELGRRRLRRGVPSLSGVVLLLALRGRTPGLRHHTVLFPADYDDEFDSIFGVGRHRGVCRPPWDPTVYISAPDDPATRPDDAHEAWFVLVNAPRHRPGDPAQGIDWDRPALADRYADRVLDVMAARGVDVRDRVLWREVRTPADLARATRSPGGSIYGTSSNGARSAFLRPGNTSNVERLYLVGGSSHPGGGIPLVGLGARIVSDLVTRDHPVTG
ncbi:MAG: phytoene desaturase family protein [Kineosporiaceae bacterium]